MEYPEWLEEEINNGSIKIKNKSRIEIRVSTVFDNIEYKQVTIEDVVYYYTHDAINFTSGCRKLADIIGDWRPIDYMAKCCLEVFKVLNIEELRRESRKHGLEPKF